MKQNSNNIVSPRPAGLALAALGNSHGYRFDGDLVRLNAMFTVLDAAAYQGNWALQLWACASAPLSASEVGGHLIAHAALPPMAELADDVEGFEISTFANSPAGSGEHVMVLALVAERNGRFDQIVDFAVYPRLERFCQPRLGGVVGYRIEGDQVHVQVGSIENPRSADNFSGSLSLELWALPAAYRGGAFSGAPVAGIHLGRLSGQHELTVRSFDLNFQRPPAGVWHFVLMLREWTAAGFVTRDYTNFALPVEFSEPAAKVTVSVTPSQPATPAVATRQPAFSKAVTPLAKASSKQPTTARSEKSALSINTASAEEIRTTVGLPLKVAQAIVKSRPFKSAEDLLRVKGVGERVLAKLRSKIKL